jgi:hypothetical protein
MMLSQIDQITDEVQVRFQPPDEDWRNHVSDLPGNALNIYLADLRENRKLRSNERIRDFSNGDVTETAAPARIDCHYLITAWSPAEPGPALEPTLDEHALLYDVTGVLMNNVPLIPRQVYEPDPLPAGFPELIADAEWPVSILPVEGFPKYGEFWGTMGVNHRWKPAVYLIVTLPVAFPTQIAGPMVTTRITEYRQMGQVGNTDVWIQIGGHVLDATNVPPDDAPTPVENAWVQLETTDGQRLQTTRTNDLGRFTFGELQEGQYRLRFSATGLGEATRDIDVPAPEYDLSFE